MNEKIQPKEFGHGVTIESARAAFLRGLVKGSVKAKREEIALEPGDAIWEVPFERWDDHLGS